MRKSSPRLFRDDLKSLFKAYKGQIAWVTILSGFLLLFLNVFIGISFYGKTINTGLKDKLGMYFYIKDSGNEEAIYKQVTNLKEKLQEEGIKTNFSTKEDSMKFLEKRLPDLTGAFQKFGIKNPLPATLYVTLQDPSQYEVLQKVMNENKEIILNIQDISQLKGVSDQEERILNVIKLSNFVQILCWVFIGALVVIVLSFLIFFLKGLFQTFKKDIQVKKLIGATASQIVQPFMWVILFSVILGFIISLLFTGVVLGIFDYYMELVFQSTVIAYIKENIVQIVSILGMEVVMIVGLSMVVSYRYVYSLHKKLK